MRLRSFGSIPPKRSASIVPVSLIKRDLFRKKFTYLRSFSISSCVRWSTSEASRTFAKNGGVTLFTCLSVVCAESMTAQRS